MHLFTQNVWTLIIKILHFIFFKILHLKLTEYQWNNLIQFVKFGLIGLSNTVISYIVYLISLFVFNHFQFSLYADYLIAQVIAFILSVLWSFYWNSQFVFEVDRASPYSGSVVKTKILDFYNELIWWTSYKEHGENCGTLPISIYT